MIQLTINGQLQSLPVPERTQGSEGCPVSGPTVAQLLAHMALQDKRIAVERNGEIVPRSQYGEQVLASGDRLEIVVAVGGG